MKYVSALAVADGVTLPEGAVPFKVIRATHVLPTPREPWSRDFTRLVLDYMTETGFWFSRLTETVWTVAETKHEIAGFASVNSQNSLTHLYVVRKWRGQGIGDELVRRAAELGASCADEPMTDAGRALAAKYGLEPTWHGLDPQPERRAAGHALYEALSMPDRKEATRVMVLLDMHGEVTEAVSPGVQNFLTALQQLKDTARAGGSA